MRGHGPDAFRKELAGWRSEKSGNGLGLVNAPNCLRGEDRLDRGLGISVLENVHGHPLRAKVHGEIQKKICERLFFTGTVFTALAAQSQQTAL